jgi:hypothetical protein
MRYFQGEKIFEDSPDDANCNNAYLRMRGQNATAAFAETKTVAVAVAPA